MGDHSCKRDTRVRRVALAVVGMPPGGKERVVMHLATEFAARGVEPIVFCLDGKGVFGERLEARGISVVALLSRKGRDIAAVWRLARLLRRFRPDVINVHDRSSLPYAFLANRLSVRRPIVVSCHGLLLKDGRRRRKSECIAMRDVRAVTAVSGAAAREYAEALDWSGTVALLPNGVCPIVRKDDLGRRVRHELGLTDDVFAFLAVGNVNPEKGYEDLLDAARLLGMKPTRPFTVLVAGGTSNHEHWQALETRLTDLGLRDTVRFLGLREDVEALYSAADAFVLSSRKEGLPMVLLEAMSAGLPVIATAVGGVPSVVRPRENGLLVPAGDPAALADAMAEMMQDAALRANLGLQAARYVEANHSVTRMASDYLAVYEASTGRTGRTADLGCRPPAVSFPRVLMLGPLPPPAGGMATVMDNLRGSALAEKCRLTVLNNGKTTPEGRSLLRGVAAQVNVLARMALCIRRERAEIVHIHTCSGFTFWRDSLHAVAARALGCRVVWHVHGGHFEQFSTHLRAAGRWWLRRTLGLGSATIVLSDEWVKRLHGFADQVCWRVVANGVPVPSVESRPVGPVPHFLFMGNLGSAKGPQDLIAAVGLARQSDLRGTVSLAGLETEPGQRNLLQARITECGCGSQVRLLGSVAGREKETVLTGSDCFVLPSYAEGLPMAMLEAMAHGMPVIATRVGAIPEVVTDGVEGFLIEPGDVAALADRLVQMERDPSLRHRMGVAARKRVEQGYSIDTMVERLMAVYKEVLTGTRA